MPNQGDDTQIIVGPGAQIGPYRIEALLGRGGMGEVWSARDVRLNRIVAIKISRAEFTDRFQREARAVAALSHPRIAALFDVGTSPAGFGYLVLEYIEGATLAETLANGGCPSARCGRSRCKLRKRWSPRMTRGSFTGI